MTSSFPMLLSSSIYVPWSHPVPLSTLFPPFLPLCILLAYVRVVIHSWQRFSHTMSPHNNSKDWTNTNLQYFTAGLIVYFLLPNLCRDRQSTKWNSNSLLSPIIIPKLSSRHSSERTTVVPFLLLSCTNLALTPSELCVWLGVNHFSSGLSVLGDVKVCNQAYSAAYLDHQLFSSQSTSIVTP